MTFPRFTIEQSDQEFYPSQFGMALFGLAVNRYTTLASRLSKAAPSQGIPAADMLRCYLGLLCQGKSDFEAIRPFFEDDEFFAAALGVKDVPSPETLRQRMDKIAEAAQWIVNFCTVELLKKLSTLSTGHMPLDLHVFTQDNSNTKKEGVSWAYRKFHGFPPIAAWLGLEGWCLEIEQRPGSQHAQESFVPFLLQAIHKSRQLTDAPLLVHLDSAHDAIMTLFTLIGEQVDFIVKWNPRGTDVPARASHVFAQGKMIKQDKKSRIVIMTETVEHSDKDENGETKTIKGRRVLPTTERYFGRDGTPLLVPDVEIEGWWTDLSVPRTR